MSARRRPAKDPLLRALEETHRLLAGVQETLVAATQRTLEQAVAAQVLASENCYLRPDVAGALLGISIRSVERACATGLLQKVTAPGTESGWRVPMSSIRELQARQLELAEMQRRDAEEMSRKARAKSARPAPVDPAEEPAPATVTM